MLPQIRGRFHEEDLPLLALLLVAGILLYFPISPGTYLTDVPEIVLPLGFVGGFIGIAYLVRVHFDSYSLERQVGYSGWIGAILGGIAGLWLASQHLATGFSVSLVYTEILTALCIGVGVGTLVGFVTATAQPRELHDDADRGAVVAETTWTKPARSDPIRTAIVEQLAELKGTDPQDVAPLSTHINVDVFDEIRSRDPSQWQVPFHTADYEIRVSSHGTVTASAIQHPGEASPAESIRSTNESPDLSPSCGDSKEMRTRTLSASPQPVRTVREAVAAHEQVDLSSLPPLEDWIDQSTLETLTGSWGELERPIEFCYVWYTVTVHPNGDVDLHLYDDAVAAHSWIDQLPTDGFLDAT